MGHYYVLGTRSENTIWGWGHNGYGNLGIGNTDFSAVPVQVLCPPPLSRNDFDHKNFIIYPNPAKQFISIINPTDKAIDKTSITDITGKTVNECYNNFDNVNIEELQPGLYIITIISDEIQQMEKFIKQ